MSNPKTKGRPIGSKTRVPMLTTIDRIVYKETTLISKDSYIRAFLVFLNEVNISPFQLDPRVVISWAKFLCDNGHTGQSVRNYVGTVIEYFLVNNFLKQVPYGDSLITIVKRRIKTLSKNDPVRNATLVNTEKLDNLPEHLKSLAVFMIMTGFRKSTILALTPNNFYLDHNESECIIIIPPKLKFLPDGSTPAVRLHCTCKVDNKVCFLHGIKIPMLPVTAKQIRELCLLLNTNPHAFRKTLATQIRIYNENSDNKIKFSQEIIHNFFVWSKNSNMYKSRYSLGWELVISHQFYSFGFLYNLTRQQTDENHKIPGDDQFIVNEQTIIQDSDSESDTE